MWLESSVCAVWTSEGVNFLDSDGLMFVSSRRRRFSRRAADPPHLRVRQDRRDVDARVVEEEGHDDRDRDCEEVWEEDGHRLEVPWRSADWTMFWETEGGEIDHQAVDECPHSVGGELLGAVM